MSIASVSLLAYCYKPEMDYVDALRRLCASNGGPEGVAQTAGLSAENLKQILRGVPLPSGNPRGVGPAVRKALSTHYPRWLAVAAADQPAVNQSFTRVQHFTAQTLPEVVEHPFPYFSRDQLFSWAHGGVLLDVDPADRMPRDGAVLLVRTVGGTPVVGQCRMTTSGFELLVGEAKPLESDRHISEVVGRCTHIGASLP